MRSDRTRRSHAENAQYYNMTVREQRPGESDLAYFRSLAKQADERLLRIERYAKQENYKGMTQYAYAAAMYDIRNLSAKPEAKRFNTVPTRTKSGAIDMRNLHAKINAVKRFLESPTSTKVGVTKVYKERANTINKKYGTDFTWQELAAYYSKNANATYERQPGSDTMLLVLDGLKKFGDIKPEDVKAAASGDLKIVGKDEVANEIANQLVAQGISFADLVPSK